MFLGAPDFARSEKKHSHRFSIFCVFTFATDPFCVSAEQCPLRSESDHHPSRDRLFTLLHTVGCRLRKCQA